MKIPSLREFQLAKLFVEFVNFNCLVFRAVNRQEFTGAHCDSVYMNRGTSNLLTMWTPFGDVNPTIGSLAICEGSNRLPEYDVHNGLTLYSIGYF